jgi:hypothetical protein
MWAVVLFAVAFRLAPPLINAVKTGYFIESFTVLDKDRIEFKASNADLFLAIQPHHIMGEVHSTVTDANGTKSRIRHNPGDRFFVRRQDLTLNYAERGGAVINTWQLPPGLCQDYSVFSTQQRKALVDVQHTFSEPTTICWFLNFRDRVNFSVNFVEGPATSRVRVGDNSSFALGLHEIAPKGSLAGHAAAQNLIVLDAVAGRVNLSIKVRSDIQFGDWTDTPSFFHPRGAPGGPQLPTYLFTVREVEMWIWGTLIGVVVLILLYSAILLFATPVKKLSLTEVQKQAVLGFVCPKSKVD